MTRDERDAIADAQMRQRMVKQQEEARAAEEALKKQEADRLKREIAERELEAKLKDRDEMADG